MRINKTRMVNTFLVSLLVAVSLLCWCGQARADQEGDYTYTVTDWEAQITGYTGAGGNVTIPDTLGGYPVKGIGLGAFEFCDSLTSVNIPEGVKSICESAFLGCSSLSSISLPQTLTSIGNHAFNNCSQLTVFSIPQSVTSIGDGAFASCYSLTSMTLPEGLISIGNDSFTGCTGLTTVSLPDGLTSIGNSAFDGCSALTTIIIPSSVTNIGQLAFVGCESITSISIPQGVTSIGDFAFADCASLTSILVAVDNEFFTSIEGALFNKLGTSILVCPAGLKSIILPQELTSIGNYAFYGCAELTSISIPKGVTSIGEGAFIYCLSLTSITADVDNMYYKSIDGVLFNKAGTSLISCPAGLTNIMFPQGLTSIGSQAFCSCKQLISISIPQGVISIGNEAFADCSSLTSINIPFGVTNIGESVFDECTSLTSITIPSSVTSVGNESFLFCESLTSINLPQGVTSIGDWAFAHCRGLASITIPSSVTRVGESAFWFCENLTGITFDSATTSIYDDAYTIPAQATIIGYDPSTAKDYAEKYNRSFETISVVHIIEVNSAWCYVSADATDQTTGDVTITANAGYDTIVGPYNANLIVTLPEGVTFSDNDTNTKTFADVGLNESTPIYLYGDTDLVIDVGADVSGSIAADVRVYVQDGGEYVLDETESQIIAKVAANNTDATLSDLSVDGTTLQDFDPANTIYNVVLPAGTTIVPTVTASVNDPGGATAEITPAASLPGITSILVTAADGITTEVYSINFTVVLPVTVTQASPNVNVDFTPLQITVPADVNNASLTTSPVDGVVTIPQVSVQASTDHGNIDLIIADGTEVSGPTDWDGTINLPQAVDTGSVTITPENGNEASVSGAIEIGLPDTTLNFSQPVRIMLAGQGGKKAGWILNEAFTPITYEMASDTAEALEANPDGYITVGSDLVIWTTHFTTFVAYTEIDLTGYTLTGQVLVEGDDLTEGQPHYSGGVTIELKQGEEIKYTTTSSEAEDLVSNGSFSITGIAAGDYTVVISKAGYLTRSFALTINSDLTLTTTSNQYLNRIYLLAGDIVSDEYNVIAASDVNYILSKFNSNSTQPGFDPQVDIVKDQYNVISAADVNLMLSNFNKNSTQYPADIIY